MSDANTLVTFLLDRTGSMQSIKDDTIGAFNAYLESLQSDEESGIRFTLVTFDSMSVDKVCVRDPVKDVAPLTPETYEPRAATPLIDATYKTIKAVEESLNGSKDKVVICIQTDGHENASTDHTWDELNALIKEKSALGWQFNFMGAGIDAYDQGTRMGIAVADTVSYDSLDPGATKAVFGASAANLRAYASGRSADTAYSAHQKRAAGDKFAPKTKPPSQPRTPAKKPAAVDDFSL